MFHSDGLITPLKKEHFNDPKIRSRPSLGALISHGTLTTVLKTLFTYLTLHWYLVSEQTKISYNVVWNTLYGNHILHMILWSYIVRLKWGKLLNGLLSFTVSHALWTKINFVIMIVRMERRGRYTMNITEWISGFDYICFSWRSYSIHLFKFIIITMSLPCTELGFTWDMKSAYVDFIPTSLLFYFNV